MSSTDKQGSSLGSFPTFPSPLSHFNWPSGFWPCVKSCLVEAATNTTARSWRAFFCVLWWGSLDRLWLRAARFGRVCSTTGYITSGLRGPSPQALNPLRRGWVYRPAPEAPRKGECRRGSEAFLELPIALGYGPVTGPTLNTALCHIRTLVGRRINTARSWRSSLRRNPAFCAVAFTLTYDVGPTSRGRPAFLPPT